MIPTIRKIQETTAEICGVDLHELLSSRQGPRTDNPLIRARHIAMFVARLMTPKSIPQIGRAFDRDHTTVIHAVRKIDIEVHRDPDLYRDVRKVICTIVPEQWHRLGWRA